MAARPRPLELGPCAPCLKCDYAVMSWKRTMMEGWVGALAHFAPKRPPGGAPRSIFVLRNNDLGDLLVVTPLFQALRELFPQAHLAAGIGDWCRDILKHNPYVDEIVPVNAPWHNKFTLPQSVGRSLDYIYRSEEVRTLRARAFDIGLDVLGSPFGSLLMMRAGIPWRLGVRGYAGGHTGTHRRVEFNSREHVGRASLRFAELLGAKTLPLARPQLYLSSEESERASGLWSKVEKTGTKTARRFVLAPGGGFPEKCWPVDRFAALAARLSSELGAVGLIVGGKQDKEAGALIAEGTCGAFVSLAGELSLRETFAVTAGASGVVCNSSVMMHASAAVGVHAFVVLGDYYSSAADHDAQWAHGEFTTTLGRGPGRTAIFDASEVFSVVRGYYDHCLH
jgi:ADP-heptose:LPS heptosyltransferase